jgi:hypothetical protein
MVTLRAFICPSTSAMLLRRSMSHFRNWIPAPNSLRWSPRSHSHWWKSWEVDHNAGDHSGSSAASWWPPPDLPHNPPCLPLPCWLPKSVGPRWPAEVWSFWHNFPRSSLTSPSAIVPLAYHSPGGWFWLVMSTFRFFVNEMFRFFVFVQKISEFSFFLVSSCI